MEEIGGVDVEELKKLGLLNADVVYIREIALAYKQKISEPGWIHGPESVISVAYIAFQWGVAAGIAKARGLTKVQKRIGFAPPANL